MRIWGRLLKISGLTLGIVLSLYDLTEGVRVLNSVSGFWGVVVGLVIFPATLVVTPVYLLVVDGNWIPILSVYGGGAISVSLVKTGSKILRKMKKKK
jgi:hypothetical protein